MGGKASRVYRISVRIDLEGYGYMKKIILFISVIIVLGASVSLYFLFGNGGVKTEADQIIQETSSDEMGQYPSGNTLQTQAGSTQAEVSSATGEQAAVKSENTAESTTRPKDGAPGYKTPENEASNGIVPADSEAVKALKRFYTYLSSEKDYPKAMEMLGTDFSLQLALLEEFGVSEIIKDDIDVESAKFYSSILKEARLDAVVGEVEKGGVSTVYFFQTVALNEDSITRLAMAAQLKKEGGDWKIEAVTDADDSKPPFTK